MTVQENTYSPSIGVVKCPENLSYPFPILVSTWSYFIACLSPRYVSFESPALKPIAGFECPEKMLIF